MSLLGKKDSKEFLTILRDRYIPLITAFLEKRISLSDFDVQYIATFQNDNYPCSYKTFSVVEAIWGSLEAYTPEPDPQKWPAEIGEEELRKCCAKNLEKLKKIVENAD